MKGRLAKVIAQVAALALVVGGLVAFVATQRGAEATASAQTASQVSAGQDGTAPGEGLGESVLQLERASQVSVELPKVVTVTAGGKTTTFATHASTIEEALRENEVSFDEDDQVSPALDTEITQDVDVTVQRVATSTESTSEEVPFETVEVEDEDLAEGETSVLAAGTPGEKTTTWSITTVDGEETDREVASTEIVREPVERRIAVGTKEPEPTRSAASSADSSEPSEPSDSSETSGTSSASQASAPTSGVWQSLAECESGGNWSINTGNGYYGGLQFSASSWAGAGGTQYAPLPHQATPAEQIATAEKLRANGGWGHWPHCSSQLGLR
ncbi:hypothetical protein GCM10009670_01860 [Citricoccus alkalitolerans]